ncbi:hypothetical protein ACXZ9C_11200 [Streptococcus agalactiae]
MASSVSCRGVGGWSCFVVAGFVVGVGWLSRRIVASLAWSLVALVSVVASWLVVVGVAWRRWRRRWRWSVGRRVARRRCVGGRVVGTFVSRGVVA